MNFDFMFHVRYVVDGTSGIKSFEFSGNREAWVKQFLLHNQCEMDNWIDLIFNGMIEYSEEKPEVIKENSDESICNE